MKKAYSEDTLVHILNTQKNIVKSLASRGLTFLADEFNTSKICPCGECELRDVDVDTSEDARLWVFNCSYKRLFRNSETV